MLTLKQLDEMSRIEITKIDKSTLVDISTMRVDTSLPDFQRMQDYLEQVKNPYCFLCGDTPVQISFKENGKELGDLLCSYFTCLKMGEPSSEV